MVALVGQLESHKKIHIFLYFFLFFVDEINRQMRSKSEHQISCIVEGIVIGGYGEAAAITGLHDSFEFTMQFFKIYCLPVHLITIINRVLI